MIRLVEIMYCEVFLEDEVITEIVTRNNWIDDPRISFKMIDNVVHFEMEKDVLYRDRDDEIFLEKQEEFSLSNKRVKVDVITSQVRRIHLQNTCYQCDKLSIYSLKEKGCLCLLRKSFMISHSCIKKFKNFNRKRNTKSLNDAVVNYHRKLYRCTLYRSVLSLTKRLLHNNLLRFVELLGMKENVKDKNLYFRRDMEIWDVF